MNTFSLAQHFFDNRCPVSNATIAETLRNAGFTFAGSNSHTGDLVAEVLGGNQGLFLTNELETAPLTTVERIQGVATLPDLILGDKYPEFDAAGNQINTTSSHSGYGCVVNCGNDGNGPRTEPTAPNEVENNE